MINELRHSKNNIGMNPQMSTPARRRLIRDFRRLRADNTTGITAAPVGDDIMTWQAIIFGPNDTAWENGVFKQYMRFSEEYPTKPPQIGFLSKIFHPNIYANGNICLDILQNQWTPIYDITKILTSIQSLLTDPNPNSPANAEAARLYTENCREYERRVHDCVEQSMLEFNQSLMEDSDDNETNIDNNCNFDIDDDTVLHEDNDISAVDEKGS